MLLSSARDKFYLTKSQHSLLWVLFFVDWFIFVWYNDINESTNCNIHDAIIKIARQSLYASITAILHTEINTQVEFDALHKTACYDLMASFESQIKYMNIAMSTAWSKLNDYNEYLEYQNWFKGECSNDIPLDKEFYLWLEEAKKGRGGDKLIGGD